MSKEQRLKLDQMLRQPKPQSDAAKPDHEPTIAERRAGFARLMEMVGPPVGVTLTDTTLGGLNALKFVPEQGQKNNTESGTILYFHGGSFMLGSPRTAAKLTAALVTGTGMQALSVDYRLAPEHPFPAGVNDCLAAYRALLESGVEPSQIALAGDSAGGGMAVTTLLAAKDAGLPLPAAAVLFSAGLDATRTGATLESKAGQDPMFTAEGLRANGKLYLGGADPHQPLASPALYGDLSGLPPLLIQVGTNELLLDDSLRLARRAIEAGVDTILDVVAGVPHVFPSFSGMLDEADQAIARATLFIRQNIAKQ